MKVQNWRRLKDLQTDYIRVNLEKLMPGLISSVKPHQVKKKRTKIGEIHEIILTLPLKG